MPLQGLRDPSSGQAPEAARLEESYGMPEGMP
jgi:hypothetical protein